LFWALAAWIGLVCGLAEGLVTIVVWQLEHRLGSPDLWVNWHAPWLAPLSLAALLGGAGIVMSLLRTLVPRSVMFLAPFVLIALGVSSVVSAVPGMHVWAVRLLSLGLAVRLGRYASFGSTRFVNLVRRSIPFVAATWAVLFVTTGVIPATGEARALAWNAKPGPNAPNVLLVVLDTVRADDLSLHGYGRPTTTHLERWARRGVRFDQARSTTSFTLGTHASLFTGCWMSETSARANAPLDGSRRTLAEHLRDRGYATAGFVGNMFYGSAHYGLDRGFLHYHDTPGNVTRRVTPREFLRASRLGASTLTALELKWRIFAPMQHRSLGASEINREALKWLDTARGEKRPFFLFVNYFDAHSPYRLPSEAPQPYSQITSDRLQARMKQLQACQGRSDRSSGATTSRELRELETEVHESMRNAYDDGIAWIDRQLNALLRGLESRGVLENTIVVITSDHGEMLGEHGLVGHGNTLYRQVVHVPLVVLGSPRMGVPRDSVVTRPVSVRDTPATILDLLHDPYAARFPGQSLARFWTAAAGDDDSLVLSEIEHMPWQRRNGRMAPAFGPMWLVTDDGWSFHRQDHETLGVREQLYNLVDDPGEERDLADDPKHSDRLAALRLRLNVEIEGQ
jgi:arylsulfatase A-like enzyme